MPAVRGPQRRDLVVAVVVALGLATAVMVGRLVDPHPRNSPGVPYVSLFVPAGTPAEVILNRGDGQAFAALAEDPTLSRPAVFGGRAEAAYRAQRPLESWLAWAGSLGDPRWVPWAIIVISVLGAGALALGAALTAAELERSTLLSVTALAAPGAVAVMIGTGPEMLGTGLALLGVLFWLHHRPAWAAALLSLAALARETLLLVVLALLIFELLQRSPLRRWCVLGVPALAYALWVAIVRLRLHAWPTDAANTRLAVPWNGVLVSVRHWGAAEIACVGVGGLLVGIALMRPLPRAYRLILGVYLAFALCMGSDVWDHWNNFGRPLLPLYVVALLAVLPREVFANEPAPLSVAKSRV